MECRKNIWTKSIEKSLENKSITITKQYYRILGIKIEIFKKKKKHEYFQIFHKPQLSIVSSTGINETKIPFKHPF